MEITTIKARAYQINVIFTGSHYFFHSPFAGVVAVAVRKGYETEEDRNTFDIMAGNRHLVGGSLGGSVMYSVAEKFIRKNENKYVEHVTNFNRLGEFDGANFHLDMVMRAYGA